MSEHEDRQEGTGPPLGADGEPQPLGAAATLPADRSGSRRRASREGGRRLRRPRVGLGVGFLLLVIAAIVLAGVPIVSGGLQKTPRDKVGISYGGGPWEGSRFQRIVEPGSDLFFNGLFDPLYLYPADQQNYIISATEGDGALEGPDGVAAPTSDRVEVRFEAAAYFTLNLDRLRAFHEELGLRYEAYTQDGWAELIGDTFRQQIEGAIQQETRRYTVDELVGSAEVLLGIQEDVQQTVSEQLVSALGQQFFCGPQYEPGGDCDPITFVVKKITIPSEIQSAFNAVQQRTNEAKAIDVLAGALRAAGDDYVLLRAVEGGNIELWVVPEGTDTDLAVTGPNGSRGATPTPDGAEPAEESTTTTTEG